MTRRGTVQRSFLLTALFLLGALLLPAISSATFAIEPGTVKVQAKNKDGNPEYVSGTHPDLDVSFGIHTTGDGTGARDLLFEFAPGLTGSPVATKTCSRAVFEFENCPEDTQVGVFFAAFFGGESFAEPIFNIAPAPNQLAALGFKPFWETELEMAVRPQDFGLNIATNDLPQLPFNAGHVELWGVPADHNGAPASERAAFLTTPSQCGPMKFKFFTRSWEPGSKLLSETAESEPFTECKSLPFEPSLGLQLTNPKPDSPTGARIDINLKPHDGADERVASDLKDVNIDLPPGLTVSPGGVEGREVCSDEQFGLGTERSVACPFGSRVGAVEVSTPQLTHKLAGSIFLGRELPGERFRLFVDASAPGIQYKAIAKLIANPQTGQLSTVLNDLPQFSVDQIGLDFEGGPHALLATPLTCGPATANARFVPYSGGKAVEGSTTVNIGPSCTGAPPFSPGLIAGSTELAAGHSTAFALTLSRQEGEQLPGKFTTTFPPGLSANLSSVPLCPAAAASSGTCSEVSKIGSAVGEVGSGPAPAKVPGGVYLTGPYKGAPFGLSIVFRAAIGPFDLGTLNVRATLAIDPHTGQVTIEHLLPAVFEGVPLRFRTIGIDLTRPGFLVNPTSCDTEQLVSTVTSVDGRAVLVSDPFHVEGCDGLAFQPKFSVALDQKGRRADNPELSFAVNVPKGQANLNRLKVSFPHVLKFHNAGIKEICARANAAEDRCRSGSQVGTAVAVSPLLSEPLRGPVYVVKPKGGGFPDLWSNVEGEGVKLQLKSESAGKHGSLITEMIDIPDLPLASFTMSVNGGGKKGALFSIDGDPCASTGALATPVELEGHNEATKTMKVQMKAGCSKSGGKKRSRSRGRAPTGSR
jgi:hypothetical protein